MLGTQCSSGDWDLWNHEFECLDLKFCPEPLIFSISSEREGRKGGREREVDLAGPYNYDITWWFDGMDWRFAQAPIHLKHRETANVRRVGQFLCDWAVYLHNCVWISISIYMNIVAVSQSEQTTVLDNHWMMGVLGKKHTFGYFKQDSLTALPQIQQDSSLAEILMMFFRWFKLFDLSFLLGIIPDE